ncbi:CHAT domain-containing protein [Streptomyces longwoodensis]
MKPDSSRQVSRRMELAREWDRLVDQVRETVPGFQDFMRRPSLDSLLPAAAAGSVVMLNVSPWRSDALIVTTAGVRNLRLPRLTLDEATARANHYLETLHEAERKGQEYLDALDEAHARPTAAAIRAQSHAAHDLMHAERRTDQMLQAMQEWLWETVAAPVLEEIGLVGKPPAGTEWPRLWWCPTGPLTLLPLHTAGYHGTAESPLPLTVLDRAVSSYTPTLRALLQARTEHRPSAAEAATDRLLVVAVEEATGQPRLHSVDRELQALSQLVTPGRLTVLRGTDADRRSVCEELERHQWVHFICHGDQNLAQPSEGGLLMSDATLTVRDISARHFRGEFAGLSACKTAVGGKELLDETITLATALHYSGYRHVVAALWSVDDEAAADVFTFLYGELAVDGTLRAQGVAPALHRAVRDLRAAHPHEPRLWTPFAHIGP